MSADGRANLTLRYRHFEAGRSAVGTKELHLYPTFLAGPPSLTPADSRGRHICFRAFAYETAFEFRLSAEHAFHGCAVEMASVG